MNWFIRGRVEILKALGCALIVSIRVGAGEVPLAELRFEGLPEGQLTNWKWSKDVESAQLTSTGLLVRVRGPDPYLVGPVVPLSFSGPMWLEIVWEVSCGGGFQVFWGEQGFDEARSVRGEVYKHGRVHSWVPLPGWSPRTRVRVDPPGTTGEVVIAALRWWPRRVPSLPTWSSVRSIGPTGAPARVSSGPLVVAADVTGWSVQVGGVPMGMADDRVWVGYVMSDTQRWFQVADCVVTASVMHTDGELRRVVDARDPDGGTWRFDTRAWPGSEGVVELQFSIECDHERSIWALPVWLLRAGAGTFGERKRQGLFCGLEYLDDEPSSSEADVTGEAAVRRAPASHKVTIPLMAIAATSRVVGLSWDPHECLQPWFDSPDRHLGGGAHAMGWFAREAEPTRPMDEGAYWSPTPWTLHANKPLRGRARILGTMGDTVVPVVALYVAAQGLPDPPKHPYTRETYARVAASGWLDTPIREGDRFRHAWTPDTRWGPQPAADAAAHLWWLGAVLNDEPLRARAVEMADRALRAVPPAQRWHAKVGAGRWIAPALLGSNVLAAADAARAAARQELGRIPPDGAVPYQPAAGQMDFAKTHSSRHASGYSAAVAERALRAAWFSGDAEILQTALERASAVRRRYRGDVPRGAQTWEIPLHTPDILASAHFVVLCVQGYEITRETEWLDDARYWAWTGVPFVYLVPPTSGPIGLYAPIAVYGATHWISPVWFGKPVHWCGLVYAEALYELSRFDSTGPWRKLADGIVASSLQAMWPADDPLRVGLLPDFIVLQSQQRGGPAINPAVLGQCAVRYFQGPEVNRIVHLQVNPWIVRVAGAADLVSENSGRAELRLTPLVPGVSRAFVSGLRETDEVIWDGRPVRDLAGVEWDPSTGRLAWPLQSAGVLVLVRH